MAQRFVELCTYGPNVIELSAFTSVGENVLLSQENVSVVNYTELVGEWYNDGADYNYSTNACSGRVCIDVIPRCVTV